MAAALFTSLNDRNPASFAALLAPNAVFHFPGTKPIRGAARIEQFVKILFFKYPRLVFEVGRVVADERRAAVEWENAGVTRDGVPYRNAGVTVLELEGDSIVYLSDTFKDTSLFVRSSGAEGPG
jgi:ketosteroid isomerase-like protein